ncbi:MAG: hypothetical protein CL908_13095 [Deltaproteobacteria bacterium]|nr:hypothetical protein [Deltaproteobacteria bacterium]
MSKHFSAVALVVLATGCISAAPEQWGVSLTDWERSAVFGDLPEEARSALLPLSEIFYERITSRRFNSRATFQDPSVRQFFPTVAAYSDYYAALVDELERANVRYSRPARVELLDVQRAPSGSLVLKLRFIGRNDLPLRWWNSSLERADEWRWQDGRWWVVPGKV